MDIKEDNLIKSSINNILNSVDKKAKSNIIRKNNSPEKLNEIFDFDLESSFENDSDFNLAIDQIIDLSLKSDSPKFMNQLYGGTDDIGIIGEIMTAFLSTSMATYEIAPLLTLMEKECVSKLAGLIGYNPKEADGIMNPGGSMSNMLAMILARDAKYPEIKEFGFYSSPKFSFFVSEYSHYSFLKGAMIFGFGKESVVKVKTDKSGRMLASDLKTAINIEIEKGRVPLMVCATAGTTINGVYDPIESIYEISRKYDLWLHVDAAYGGSLLFSETNKKYLKGIENADSVAWNLHKMMGLPLSCAFLITKENGKLVESMSTQANYLFHEDNDNYDLGNKSIQCGRKVDSLKLWLSWKYKGSKGFENRIENMVNTSRYFADKIKKSENFELFCEPEASIVCFQFKPKNTNLSLEQINELNKNIRDHYFYKGEMVFNYSHIKDLIVIRCVISSPDVTNDYIDELFSKIETLGLELIK